MNAFVLYAVVALIGAATYRLITWRERRATARRAEQAARPQHPHGQLHLLPAAVRHNIRKETS